MFLPPSRHGFRVGCSGEIEHRSDGFGCRLRLNFSPLPDDTYLMVLEGVVYMAVPFYKRARKIEEKPGDIGLAVALARAEEGEVADVEDARGNRLLVVVNLEVREAAHGEIGVRDDDGDDGGPKPGTSIFYLQSCSCKGPAGRVPGRRKQRTLIDDFIPTIEGKNAICYPHPKRLPGSGTKDSNW
ncbi:hypothetical protein PVAP13_8NG307800 [Panicum virgatum]|uniref:Uncharacterized protein n=1 Tax=Panicum virgatum TaxID=38727 RepID=A0A8T0PMG8_PANVG|nr:hypothetical protein PVAP13_8NG307800 [Panicum virgatum]